MFDIHGQANVLVDWTNWPNFFIASTRNSFGLPKNLLQPNFFVASIIYFFSRLKNPFTHIQTSIHLDQSFFPDNVVQVIEPFEYTVRYQAQQYPWNKGSTEVLANTKNNPFQPNFLIATNQMSLQPTKISFYPPPNKYTFR